MSMETVLLSVVDQLLIEREIRFVADAKYTEVQAKKGRAMINSVHKNGY